MRSIVAIITDKATLKMPSELSGIQYEFVKHVLPNEHNSALLEGLNRKIDFASKD